VSATVRERRSGVAFLEPVICNIRSQRYPDMQASAP